MARLSVVTSDCPVLKSCWWPCCTTQQSAWRIHSGSYAGLHNRWIVFSSSSHCHYVTVILMFDWLIVCVCVWFCVYVCVCVCDHPLPLPHGHLLNCHHLQLLLTPSLPQPVKFPGWKVHTYTPPNSICDGTVTNLLPILCINRNPFTGSCEGGKTSLNGFKFGTFIGSFPRDGAASMAVNGLITAHWSCVLHMHCWVA